MDWLLWSFIAACVIGAVVALYVTNNPTFWTLAARNPDLALALLEMEGCLIDGKPDAADEGRYTGPSRLRTSDQVLHTVYMPNNRAEIIASKLGAILKTTQRVSIPKAAGLARGRGAVI